MLKNNLFASKNPGKIKENEKPKRKSKFNKKELKIPRIKS